MRLASKALDTSKRKGKLNPLGLERETKQEQRQKKKDLRKQSHRTKDYYSCEEKEFSVALLALQLKINYMDGDGNCLFRSIADQMTGECSNVIIGMTEELFEIAVNWIYGTSNKIHFHLRFIVLTHKCIYQHHEIRSSIVKYIEEEKDHFSLFMDEEELFEEYTDRMK